MATLQEIQNAISQVQTNIGFYQARALDTNASSVQRAVANSQVALFLSKLVELKNQEQELLASSSMGGGIDQRITEMENENKQSFFAKNKWWFIGGGVLLVGGIATFLILRRKN